LAAASGDEPEDAEPADAVLAPGPLRRALLRALLAAVVGGAVAALVAAATISAPGLRPALVGVTGGVALAPLFLLEQVLLRRAPEGRGIALGSLLVFVAAAGLAWLAVAQARYTSALLEGDGRDAAFASVEWLLRRNWERPAEAAAHYGSAALPFALTFLGRASGLRLFGQVATALLGALPLAGAVLFGGSLVSSTDGIFTFFMVAAGAVGLPIAHWGADRVEARLWGSAVPAGPALRRPGVAARAVGALALAAGALWGLFAYLEGLTAARTEAATAARAATDPGAVRRACAEALALEQPDPVRAELLKLDGKALLAQGELAAAEARFGEAIAIDPRGVDGLAARLRRAEVRRLRGDLAGALADVEALLAHGGLRGGLLANAARLERARILLRRGDRAAARRDVKAVYGGTHPDRHLEEIAAELAAPGPGGGGR